MEFDAKPDGDLAEGTMTSIEVRGHKLLLAKVGGICHAVAATCPHAGAQLAEGVMRGDTVICPWHKAAFCVTTGRRTDPPALDDLALYATRVVDGRVLVTVDEAGDDTAVRREPTVDRDTRIMAIIGAGAAGVSAAQTLRALGFTGRVVLIGDEDRLPYDRTVLSKYTLSGKEGGEKSPLQDEAFYENHRIERLLRRVASLHPATRTIGFADGGRLTYDAALLATGSQARELDVPGGDLPGVFLLRSAADAEAIVAAAAYARSLIVVGAGFIGMEAAASLRERGMDVTVVAPQDAPFEKLLGRRIGDVFRRVHEREGVALRFGEEVVAVEGDGRVERVRLRSGESLPADIVVVGLGVSPATDMLQEVTRRQDGSIDVDAQLRAADGLYVAGDIAAFPWRGTGERIRVEHWRVAQQHGVVAAVNMLGGTKHYEAAPYFWTIHFLKRLDYVGHAQGWDDIVIDGDLEKPEFVAFYLKDAKVVAVAGWGRDRQMAAAVALMTERADWPVSALRRELQPFV